MAITSTLSPEGAVKDTILSTHWINPFHRASQLIPRITSIPSDSRIIGVAGKSTPLIFMLICGHMRLVFIFPLGDVTSIAFFMGRVMRLCLATKRVLMKECDAPVSNKTVVRDLQHFVVPPLKKRCCYKYFL